MYKRLVSLVINVNRITPMQPTKSNNPPSGIIPTKPKKKRRNRYRHGKRNQQIISDLKNKIHIADIVQKYKCSLDYIAYLMFLHRYRIDEITDITGVTTKQLLSAYLRY